MQDNDESFAIFTVLLRSYLPLSDSAAIDRSDNLIDLGLDSFSAIEILMQLEEVFGVRLPDEEITLKTFATVGSLWSVLTRSANAGPAGAGV